MKERPTWKPSSSKSGTCQDQNSFTMAYQTLFWKRHLETCVTSPSLGYRGFHKTRRSESSLRFCGAHLQIYIYNMGLTDTINVDSPYSLCPTLTSRACKTMSARAVQLLHLPKGVPKTVTDSQLQFWSVVGSNRFQIYNVLSICLKKKKKENKKWCRSKNKASMLTVEPFFFVGREVHFALGVDHFAYVTERNCIFCISPIATLEASRSSKTSTSPNSLHGKLDETCTSKMP